MLVGNPELPENVLPPLSFKHFISYALSRFSLQLFTITLLPLYKHSYLPCLELRIALKYNLVKVVQSNKPLPISSTVDSILLLSKTSYTWSVTLQISSYFLALLPGSLALLVFCFKLFYFTTCIELFAGSGQTPWIFSIMYHQLIILLSCVHFEHLEDHIMTPS